MSSLVDILLELLSLIEELQKEETDKIKELKSKIKKLGL